MARLIFKESPHTYFITKRLTILSASSDADIHLSGAADTLSFIEKKSDTFYMETIKGKGIIVNNKLVRRHKLEFGDIINTGDDLAVFLNVDIHDLPPPEPGISENINSLLESDEFKDIAGAIIEKLMAETYAEKGMVLLLEDGEPSILVGAEKDSMDLIGGFSETIIRTVLLDKKPLISNNVLSDERFSPSKSITALKIMATMVIPILRHQTVYGFVYLWNSSIIHPFSDAALISGKFYARILSMLIENERLKSGINTTLKRVKTNRHVKTWYGFESAHPAMIAVFDQCEKIARTNSNVVFCGEQGTGRKALAKIIHQISHPDGYLYTLKIKDKSPEILLDELSMLFLSDSAAKAKNGDGTIIIDGLDCIPENLQSVVAGIIDKNPDARWIFLMTGNPDEIEHPFDKRLRARLGEIIVHVPSLRDRGADTSLFAAGFLYEFCAAYSKDIKGFTGKAEKLINSYKWNGNVAELKDVIKKAVIEAESDMIEADLLDIKHPEDQLTPLGKAKEEFMKRYIKMALAATDGNKIKTANMLKVSYRTIYKYLEGNK